MSTDKPTTPADQSAEATAAFDADSTHESRQPGGPDGGHHPDDVIAALRIDLVRAREEASEFKDRWLRSQAELDNIRKRAEREKVDTAKYAISKFAQDMVNVGDNFERAISTAPPEALADDGLVKGVLEGVAIIEREFMNALARHGIKRTEPQGQPFNPSHQQAVMEVQDASVPNGTVVKVFQPGYLIEDRVLRHAMVVVAKGGPKGPPPLPENAGQSAPENGTSRPEN